VVASESEAYCPVRILGATLGDGALAAVAFVGANATGPAACASGAAAVNGKAEFGAAAVAFVGAGATGPAACTSGAAAVAFVGAGATGLAACASGAAAVNGKSCAATAATRTVRAHRIATLRAMIYKWEYSGLQTSLSVTAHSHKHSDAIGCG
jgi:hypothetical protein